MRYASRFLFLLTLSLLIGCSQASQNGYAADGLNCEVIRTTFSDVISVSTVCRDTYNHGQLVIAPTSVQSNSIFTEILGYNASLFMSFVALF